MNKILSFCEQGQKEGATLHCGGMRKGTEGYFVESTVFSDVKDNMKIATEEVGPIQYIYIYTHTYIYI